MTDADATRRYLLEIPELCALLPDAAITRTSIEGPRPAPGSKPPLRLDVLHLLDAKVKHWDANMATCDPDRQGVLPYLFGWCRDIEADALDQSPQLPPELPQQATVAGCCGWLTTMLGFAATLPQWFELADGIKVIHGRIRAATSEVRDLERKPVICNRCHAGNLVESGPKLWRCDACHREVVVQAVTLIQAAPLVGIGQATLYRWAKRNLFERVGDQGGKIYDLGSIRRVVAENRMRTNAG